MKLLKKMFYMVGAFGALFSVIRLLKQSIIFVVGILFMFGSYYGIKYYGDIEAKLK